MDPFLAHVPFGLIFSMVGILICVAFFLHVLFIELALTVCNVKPTTWKTNITAAAIGVLVQNIALVLFTIPLTLFPENANHMSQGMWSVCFFFNILSVGLTVRYYYDISNKKTFLVTLLLFIFDSVGIAIITIISILLGAFILAFTLASSKEALSSLKALAPVPAVQHDLNTAPARQFDGIAD